MGYSIELKNRITGETAKMRHPQYVRRGQSGQLWIRQQESWHRQSRRKPISTLPAITAITITKLRTEISGLLMRKFQFITQMRHRDRQKQNMASEACTVLLLRSPFQC